MPIVYIGGPFSASTQWQIEQNIRAAEAVGFEVAEAGASPLIPHANTRHFHGEQSSQFWYDATMALLEKADAVMLVKGWERSKGTKREVARANRLGIPVFSRIADLENWVTGRE